jgi:hypothetical protein
LNSIPIVQCPGWVSTTTEGPTPNFSVPKALFMPPPVRTSHGALADSVGKLTGLNKLFIFVSMIRSFVGAETERFFSTGRSRRLPTAILTRAAMRLTPLNAAIRIDDLRLPPLN